MAWAKQCDRCGEYFTPNLEHEPFKINKQSEHSIYAFNEVDVCHNCLEDLREWWEAKHDKPT